jgi:phosphoribosylpyrophosphate synthetase
VLVSPVCLPSRAQFAFRGRAECAKNPKIVTLSVAPLLAQAVYNIHSKKSVSALFK